MSNGSDSVDFELNLKGNTASISDKMAAALARLEAHLKSLRSTSERTDKGLASTRDSLVPAATAAERLRKSYTSLAPASALLGRSFRALGVHGGALRRITVDAAKSEIALRRLYRLKGGGLRGAASVASTMSSRGGLPQKAGSLAMRGAMGSVGMVGGASLAVGGAAAVGAGLLSHNMASTAIEAERVRFALDRVTNGDGAKWWEKSSEYAMKFGMNVINVADNLKELKSSGFDDATVETLFSRMGDLRAIGATEEKIGRAMLAIRQIANAGRLQGDELNQLGEADINPVMIYQALEKKLGKSRDQILKMKEAGKLTSDLVIPAIAEAIGTKTGGGAAGVAGAAAANSTVSGLWGKLTGTWSVVSANALQGDQLAPLRDSIATFTSWMTGSGGSAAIGAFAGVMTRMFAAAPIVIDKVIWLLDTGLPAAWEAFSSAFASSGGDGALSQLIQGATRLGGDDGGKMIAFLQSAATAAGNLAGAITNVLDVVMQLASSPLAQFGMSVATAPVNALGAISGFLTASPEEGSIAAAQAGIVGSDVGSSMALGMSQSLYAGAPLVAAAASFLAQSAEDAARATSETHSPSRAWFRYGEDNVAGLEGAYKQGIPTIQSAAVELARSPSSSGSWQSNTSSVGNVTVNVSIDRGQGEGRSDSELLELASEIFERKMARLLSRLAYSGAC